jgi:hypothetical protein
MFGCHEDVSKIDVSPNEWMFPPFWTYHPGNAPSKGRFVQGTERLRGSFVYTSVAEKTDIALTYVLCQNFNFILSFKQPDLTKTWRACNLCFFHSFSQVGIKLRPWPG